MIWIGLFRSMWPRILPATCALVLLNCNGDNEAVDTPAGPVPYKIEANGRFFHADEHGRALILHGVNIIDDFDTNSADPRPGIVSEEDFQFMASIGFNFVRLTRFWHALEPQQGDMDEAYLERTRQLLYWCHEYGMHVVLDMHQDIYSYVFTGRGMPEWVVRDDGHPFQPIEPWWLNNVQPAVTASWDHYWRDDDIQQSYTDLLLEYVRRFKDHPAVIGYDLINEPYQGSAAVSEFERTTLTHTYQKWVEAVRAEDSENWIFYEPVSWIVNTSLAPSNIGVLDEDRAVYFPHLYSYTNDLNLPWNGDPAFIFMWEGRALKIIEQQESAGMIGEFGVNASIQGHNDFLREVLEMVNRSLSGWAYWEYGYVKHLSEGGEPYGQEFVSLLAQPYARRVAGKPLVMRFDAKGKVFELEFVPSPALSHPTELFLSVPRYYPRGWRITTTDRSGRWSYRFDPSTSVLQYFADQEAPWCALRIEPSE